MAPRAKWRTGSFDVSTFRRFDVSRPRRGGVLLEVIISIALFIGAGAFVISSMRTTFSNIERAQREQFAIDLARSKMAELEAGLTTIADLRGETVREVGSHSFDEEFGGRGAQLPGGWVCEVRTQRTEFRDLTLIELTVREDRGGTGKGDPQTARFTLRQLIKLAEFDPEEYEEDDLLRGLEPGGDG